MATGTAGNSEETLSQQPQNEEEEEDKSCNANQEIRVRLKSIDEKINAIWERLQETTGSGSVSLPSASVDVASHNDGPGEGEEPMETPLTRPTYGGDAGPGYLIIW